MKIYLAGRMSGIPSFNFPEFNAAATHLRSQGHEVFNPAERDVEEHGAGPFMESVSDSISECEAEHGFSLREALAAGFTYICREAEAIAMLPGWEYSSGAVAEWNAARTLRLDFIYLREEDYK